MDPSRWKQIEELYHAALECEPDERAAFLARAHPGLRREVESLLAQESSATPLDQPAWEGAASLLGSTVAALPAGTQLGPYKIQGPLGAGGMGEVFRAVDTRLGRAVAIKTSQAQFSERFEREARAISALNHPNICTLYDVGPNYLVMELVEGETLAARLKRGKLAVADTLKYGAQIADALAAAHAKGIVHRDLKPGNIMVTKTGVKVLDFGLAKSAEDATLTATRAVMGTPAYMAPEQQDGKECDARADIYAFGLMLSEMITGKRSQPPAATDIPPDLLRLMQACSAPDPDDRIQSARDVKTVLTWVAMPQPFTAPRPKRTWILYAGVAVGIAVGTAATLWISNRGSGVPFLDTDTSLINLASYTGTERSGAISPDGKFFAFVSERGGLRDIWVRQVSGGDPVQITRDGGTKLDLVYAPDGESIYYSSSANPRTIWRIGVLGGTARKILEDARYPAPSPDGKSLAFVKSSANIGIANTDGTGTRLIASVLAAQSLQWSPDGRRLAYTAGSLFDPYQVHIIDADGNNHKQLTSYRSGFVNCIAWLRDSRHVVYGFNPAPGPDAADLFSVSTDGRENSRLSLLPQGAFQACSISADGKRLLGSIENTDAEIWKAPLDGDPVANGKAAVRFLDRAWQPMWAQIPRVGMLLFNSPATGTRNLWISPLAGGGTPRQITFLPTSRISHSALSPDGSRVAYVSTESGGGQIWAMNSDGSGAQRLTNSGATNFWPFWSPDGKWIGFTSIGPAPVDIWKVPASGGAPVQITHRNGFRGDWSPDGSRIAYDRQALQGNPGERGQAPVGIEIAAASTSKVLTEVEAPTLMSPVWSPDGKRLSATSGNSVWIIDPETGQRRLAVQFPANFFLIFRAAWTPDGKSVIVNRQERTSRIVLLENLRLP